MPFLVWMSLSEEDKLIVARARKSKDFFRSLSLLLKYLLALQENMYSSRIQLEDLKKSLMVSMMISLSRRSILSVA